MTAPRRGVPTAALLSAVVATALLTAVLATVLVALASGPAAAATTARTPAAAAPAGPGTVALDRAAPLAAPVARCDLSATEIEPGESVTLNASASEGAELYRYDRRGNGAFGEYVERETRTFTYSEAGTYEPRVQVRAPDDSTDTARCGALTVAENQPPNASFSYTPSSPAPGETVTFTGNASDPGGQVVGYLWEVDGRAVGETAELSYAFQEPGKHTVRLTVRDDDGATTTVNRTVTVAGENRPPVVEFTVSPSPPEAGETATLTAEAADEDGEVVAYRWRVDGEPVAEGPELTYTFEEPGTHVVSVTVTDDDGATATVEREVTVRGATPTPTPVERTAAPGDETPAGTDAPSADWWHSPVDPLRGETVTLLASETAGGNVSFGWDLDDDGTVEKRGAIVAHRFTRAGEHTVTLRVTGPDGRTSSVTRTVSVVDQVATPGGEAQESPLWYAPVAPRPGESVTLVADPAGADDTDERYRWDLDGDGTTDASGPVVSHDFATTGRYSVTLTVERADGTTTTVNRTIAVGNPTPTGTPTATPTAGATPTATGTAPPTATATGPGTRTAPRETGTTSGDGPGFGPVLALVALAVLAVRLGRGGSP